MKTFNTFISESTTAKRDLALKVHAAHSAAATAHLKKLSHAHERSKKANEMSAQLGKNSEEFTTDDHDDHGKMMAAHNTVEARLERRYKL